jgi:hypothetical protein
VEAGRVALPSRPRTTRSSALVRAEEPVKPPFAERNRGVDDFERWSVEFVASIDLSCIPS